MWHLRLIITAQPWLATGALALAGALGSTAAGPAGAQSTPGTGPTQVFVVATLYARHDQAPVYGLPALRGIIDAVKPEVMVLDVTPTELKQQKVWPGKVEYTGVVFPYLNSTRIPAYGSEPAEALFAQISGAAGAAYQRFGKDNPAGAAALDGLKGAAYKAMISSWKTPADANSAATDKMVAGLREIEETLVGGSIGPLQEQWDEHHAARLLDAARAHPGARVLMLVGIESRYRVMQQLRKAEGIQLVDVEAWLRKQP